MGEGPSRPTTRSPNESLFYLHNRHIYDLIYCETLSRPRCKVQQSDITCSHTHIATCIPRCRSLLHRTMGAMIATTLLTVQKRPHPADLITSLDVFYQKPRFPPPPAKRWSHTLHFLMGSIQLFHRQTADHTRWRVKRQATRTRCVSKHTIIPPLSRHTFTEHSPLSQQPSSMSLDPYNILFDRTPLSLWHCSLTTSYPLTQRTQDPFKC